MFMKALISVYLSDQPRPPDGSIDYHNRNSTTQHHEGAWGLPAPSTSSRDPISSIQATLTSLGATVELA